MAATAGAPARAGRQRRPHHRSIPARPRGAGAPAPQVRVAAGARLSLFLAPRAQHVTRSLVARALLGDLLAAGATAGALALWGLALHLLAG
jgi:hypothetical protein